MSPPLSLDVRGRGEGRVTPLLPPFYRSGKSLRPGCTNQSERPCSTGFLLTWCRAGVMVYRGSDPPGWTEAVPGPGHWGRWGRGRPAAARAGRERSGARRPDAAARAGAAVERAPDGGCSAGDTGWRH